MTGREENYLFNTLERIRDETHENNIMLRKIVKAINYHTSNTDNENNEDFIRNVLANLVSNRMFNFK